MQHSNSNRPPGLGAGVARYPDSSAKALWPVQAQTLLIAQRRESVEAFQSTRSSCSRGERQRISSNSTTRVISKLLAIVISNPSAPQYSFSNLYPTHNFPPPRFCKSSAPLVRTAGHVDTLAVLKLSSGVLEKYLLAGFVGRS